MSFISIHLIPSSGSWVLLGGGGVNATVDLDVWATVTFNTKRAPTNYTKGIIHCYTSPTSELHLTVIRFTPLLPPSVASKQSFDRQTLILYLHVFNILRINSGLGDFYLSLAHINTKDTFKMWGQRSWTLTWSASNIESKFERLWFLEKNKRRLMRGLGNFFC